MWWVLGVLVVALAGCGADGDLVVGVRLGHPGLVNRLPDGTYTGFDVAVATYVARELGYRDDQVIYTLDMASADIALEPITKGRAFAGPYLVTSEDILVRARDLSVRGVRDLADRRVCGTSDSGRPLARRLGTAWKNANLAVANVPAACVPLMADGRMDAIVADAPVLAGIDAQYPGRFRLVGRSISEERYGIALRDPGMRVEVNDALRHMFEDGTWNRAVIEHLGILAPRYPQPPLWEG
ncbi:transporter substrate-binding domain-containing protein [Streptosporangiaceae bacterium NEAU-GS5]|nr:transporter substrate-binding domain-containing protein [Streptosporangiaceae bacterium NEAU-GS5]